jgi:hypothetical protein
MKTILLLTPIIFIAAARADEQVISTFSWKELADAGKLTAGTLTGAPDDALKVENRGPDAMSATVLTIVQPKITTDFYAVSGQVRYDNVEGDGFLEMWSHFGETAAYFPARSGWPDRWRNSRVVPTGARSRSLSMRRARVRGQAS